MAADRVFDENQAVWREGAAEEPEPTPLAGDATVDVAIIGGGFTGVSTAYHLSRRFPERGVVLLEARRLANGASGRNGGMMLNGVTDADDPETIIREHALTRAAMDGIEGVIREHGLRVRCRRAGTLRIATTARGAEEAHAAVERLGGRLPLRFLAGRALDDTLRIRGAHGAVLDPTEGMLNGVDLIRGMRRVLAQQGVRIHEDTRVTAVREGATIELVTPRGTVRAKAIVLATNGYTPRLGYFRHGILPVISHVIATAPLDEALLAATGLGGLAGFSDDRPRLAYATLDPERRLIFGGGATAAYGYRFANATAFAARLDDAPARALRRELHARFPALAGVPIAHRWSGPLGLTRTRRCAMGVRGAHRNVYYALGYSGHGVVLANLAGRVLTDLYAGDHDPWRGQAFYMASPSWIPPEKFSWRGYQIITRVTGRSPWKHPPAPADPTRR
jgi:glycine/D-amino acid oxidase-like deaminating enzyme